LWLLATHWSYSVVATLNFINSKSPAKKSKKVRKDGGSLPPCKGSPISSLRTAGSWTDCFGSYTFVGGKYFGEWKNGKMTGQGIETYANGSNYCGNYLQK